MRLFQVALMRASRDAVNAILERESVWSDSQYYIETIFYFFEFLYCDIGI